jgi:hypothetical protein
MIKPAHQPKLRLDRLRPLDALELARVTGGDTSTTVTGGDTSTTEEHRAALRETILMGITR